MMSFRTVSQGTKAVGQHALRLRRRAVQTRLVSLVKLHEVEEGVAVEALLEDSEQRPFHFTA
jgi:hypothetical protein